MSVAEASAFAPGKLILAGEHAVVYGHPAIAVAVDRGTWALARRRPGPSGVDRSTLVGDDGEEQPFPEDDRLVPALRTVLPETGVGLEIRTDLPIGRGMGSSASLAVAVVRATAALQGEPADIQTCIARGFAVERVFHGTPSGLDHTVSARGGALWYRRGPEGLELRPLRLPPLALVVLDSGCAGNTASMVAGVRARRPGVDGALERIGALVGELEAALAAGDLQAAGALLDEDHRLLAEIGVSTPDLDRLVSLARGAGALGAKLAGAGGGGVVLALVREAGPLLLAARAHGVRAFSAGLSPATEDSPCPP